MKKQEVRSKMMHMGFCVCNNGFNFIAEALNLIDESNCDIKNIEMNRIIADIYNTSERAVEKAIWHEMRLYYKSNDCHPLLLDKNKSSGRYSAREFLFRLHEIVYGEWA